MHPPLQVSFAFTPDTASVGLLGPDAEHITAVGALGTAFAGLSW